MSICTEQPSFCHSTFACVLYRSASRFNVEHRVSSMSADTRYRPSSRERCETLIRNYRKHCGQVHEALEGRIDVEASRATLTAFHAAAANFLQELSATLDPGSGAPAVGLSVLHRVRKKLEQCVRGRRAYEERCINPRIMPSTPQEILRHRYALTRYEDLMDKTELIVAAMRAVEEAHTAGASPSAIDVGPDVVDPDSDDEDPFADGDGGEQEDGADRPALPPVSPPEPTLPGAHTGAVRSKSQKKRAAKAAARERKKAALADEGEEEDAAFRDHSRRVRVYDELYLLHSQLRSADPEVSEHLRRSPEAGYLLWSAAFDGLRITPERLRQLIASVHGVKILIPVVLSAVNAVTSGVRSGSGGRGRAARSRTTDSLLASVCAGLGALHEPAVLLIRSDYRVVKKLLKHCITEHREGRAVAAPRHRGLVNDMNVWGAAWVHNVNTLNIMKDPSDVGGSVAELHRLLPVPDLQSRLLTTGDCAALGWTLGWASFSFVRARPEEAGQSHLIAALHHLRSIEGVDFSSLAAMLATSVSDPPLATRYDRNRHGLPDVPPDLGDRVVALFVLYSSGEGDPAGKAIPCLVYTLPESEARDHFMAIRMEATYAGHVGTGGRFHIPGISDYTYDAVARRTTISWTPYSDLRIGVVERMPPPDTQDTTP